MKQARHTLADGKANVQITSFGKEDKITEYHIMFHVDGSDDFNTQLKNLQNAFNAIIEQYLPAGAMPVFRRYFLSDATNQLTELQESLKQLPECATSIVQQPPLDGSKIALWAYFIKGMEVASANPYAYIHNGYTHSWVARLNTSEGDSEAQTDRLFHEYENTLEKCHSTLKDNCIRTWLFVQNVDVNYTGVVKARRDFFAIHGLSKDTHYLASTGIEGRDADPNVLVLMDAYSVDGLAAGQINYLYAPTHLSPTYIYNVTFERGTTVTYGDRKHFFISGTASIDSKGNVVHIGNVYLQALRLLENVEKLLEEGGATMDNLALAIVYLRDASDYGLIEKLFSGRFPQLPVVIVHAPVCRPTWLIEMETIAIIPQSDSRYEAF